ncbi:hypothetical protein HPO96_11110 [Kribbella sandramycini]|uniref:Ricin B lectin domain-containing protein n=1 Tax=Kribbella sandramycini TaxID=60450 RepID=A0A7Y4KY41_9ACTN|nr:RICIN domain-containing protein [Kribbella sandramycini]MBB6569367.1 hypothetical protein [Kribbella sandramycini]NOL40794.1 hypothetical protein [Kribbella sandramycini]
MSARRRRLLPLFLSVLLAVPLIASVQGDPPAATAQPGTVSRPRTPEVIATDEAARTGRRVEVTNWRSETGEIYVNPDGSKTMTQHATPVRVRSGSRWVAPDPTLRRQRGGNVRPVAATVSMVLSGGGGKTLLTMGEPGKQLVMGWPDRLPVPRLEGDTATYPEVYRGVDLRIKVAVDNFSYLLVVKDRDAALNDALRALRTPFVGKGLRVSVGPDGSTTARDALGATVFSAPPPTMWDSTPGTPRQAKVGIRLRQGQLELTPQRALLTDPRARFPIHIDPSMSGRLAGWLHVNVKMGGQTGWGYDTKEGAKVGRAYRDRANLYRSLFLMNLTNGAQTIAGTTVTNAEFGIDLDHSPTGTPTPVDLWHLKDFDTGTYIDWDNNSQFWRENVATRSAEAYPPPEDKAVLFKDSARLVQLVQQAANDRRTTIGFGLRAPDEGAENQWKKFKPDTAVLSVTYNSAPREPKSLNLVRPRPCGTTDAPTPIGTRTPQFSAVANDPDSGDEVTTTLEIRNAANAVVHSGSVGPTATGAAFSWAEVPAGTLNENEVYRYRAFTRDTLVAGPATADCYFVIDSRPPGVPAVASVDFPDGSRKTPAYQTGTVTFRPAAGQESEVTEYVYGFSSDKLAMRIKAGAGGVATVPITLTPSGQTGSFDRELYVVAVDKAGNESEVTESWGLRAKAGGAAPAPVRGDSNGDGKADLNAIFDQGFGRTAIWTMPSAGAAFHPGVMSWDTGEGGVFALTRSRAVQGDWDGDGRADMALIREGAGRQIWLYKLRAEGNRYEADTASWTSGANGWPLSTARIVAGDVDGDGKADIAVQNATADGGFEVLVFTAASNFAQPVNWLTSDAAGQWTRSTPVLADLDGDRKADFVSMRNLDGCRTSVEVFRSSGTGFAAGASAYDSGAGNYCWEKSKISVGDPDGDGRDDLVALYEDTPAKVSLQVFKPSGATLSRSAWWSVADNELDLSKTNLSVGDFNGDRKDDIALLYAGGSAPGVREAFTQLSTGAAFGARQQTWSGQVDAVTGPKFELEHRSYDLVSKNSNKCLNVEFASTADDARYIQYGCLPVDLNARFRLTPIAGTDQFSVRPMHSMKCADVADVGLEDGQQLLQWPCGSGSGEPTANQQLTVEYIEGTSYDTVVQLRFAHSKKCATVYPDGDKTVFDDYAPIKQQTCGQLTTQQWTLRPSYNQTQLGENGNARYRIEAATSHHVLDIEHCIATNNIRMWEWVPGSPCQQWKLESLGDDVYKIVDPSSNRALDIQGCSKLPKGTVIAWASNNSECQHWRIEPSPDGSYAITSVSSGLALDVDSCNPAKGTDVITWTYHGAKCQRWFFIKQ